MVFRTLGDLIDMYPVSHFYESTILEEGRSIIDQHPHLERSISGIISNFRASYAMYMHQKNQNYLTLPNTLFKISMLNRDTDLRFQIILEQAGVTLSGIDEDAEWDEINSDSSTESDEYDIEIPDTETVVL